MIGVDSVAHAILVIGASVVAMLLFVAATQNWFLVRSRYWESALLLVACFVMFRPGFLMDRLAPPFIEAPASELMSVVAASRPGEHVRIRVTGENLRGDPINRTVALRLDAGDSPEGRLAAAGLTLLEEDGRLYVQDVGFRTEAAKIGLDLDYEIVSVLEPNPRPPKELFYLLGLALAGLVAWTQRRRSPAGAPRTATP